MPREFPTSIEILQQLVEIPTDVETPRGRKGLKELHEYVKDLVKEWGLGEVTEQEFKPEDPYGNEDPRPSNLFIDVNRGEGRERALWLGHADTIYPDEIYEESQHKPLHFMQDEKRSDIYWGCGTADMKSGIAACLSGLRGLDEIVKRTNRWIRLAIVYGEERESEGAFVAKPYLQGSDWGISMDVPVDGHLDDEATIYNGRPGRAVFDVTIEGLESMHMGRVDPNNPNLLARRLSKAIDTLLNIQLPSHPKHPKGIMPNSYCYPNEVNIQPSKSLTTTSLAAVKVEVLYTNPALGLPEIESEIRRALRSTLERGCHVELHKDRKTPWIKPWYEGTDHPLVNAAVEQASYILGTDVKKKVGRGVADENIPAHLGIPMIIFPPRAEGEHTIGECVDTSYIDSAMVPFLQRMADLHYNPVNWGQNSNT
ncbi:M20/M25/M40 family metallo-hydrolase [Patescibacteria group bacterium]|nr:M20/M25/M40 family metallo-hydrolase [Patescibacteria group bacterium]